MVKDAIYWANKIKFKEVSSQELLMQTYQKIKKLNPKYNAVVAYDYEQALKTLSQDSREHESLVFGGVPIALKMLGQAKAGWQQTASSKLLVNGKANETDYFVSALEQVGFIPFGQTNAPEFGFKNITDSELYGVTKNVWQPSHHAGGSSGGAASALASGIYPIVAASDGGGSIRIPASFSGVIGLKPTRGSMPNGPKSWRDWQGASINFALTVSMRDTESLFYSIRGGHRAAPYYNGGDVIKEYSKLTSKLKIAACLDSPVANPVSSDAKEAYQEAIKFLVASGHEVTEVPYPVSGDSLIRSYYAMNGAETASMVSGIERGLGRRIVKNDLELMSWGLYQYGKHLPAATYIESLDQWDQAAYQMETLFETFDLFLSPTATTVAPKISQDLQSNQLREKLSQADQLSESELAEVVYDMFEKSLYVTPYTQLANLTGQPAISLPTFVNREGLPLGIQLMASKGNEAVLFKIGKEFEAAQQFLLPKNYRE
ncbi:amidase [Vagococcus intermedius]|uniref:Amidase n=1 Tax=Vagococcus intermedius TaxID=2991418 RepID=A0AAF0CUM6_9ENTE|nr:amidase [Vagococcus intermedius]WEG73223.1 amidase [Vagococcus intermedius]WEG75308.1 amidase [Vagococcus intermedius]